jgi:hypothetical protein
MKTTHLLPTILGAFLAIVPTSVPAVRCHIYSDGGDVVYADSEFLGIYSPAGGNRTIRLPQRSNVIDLLSDKMLAHEASEFSVDLPANTTLLLKVDGAVATH